MLQEIERLKNLLKITEVTALELYPAIDMFGEILGLPKYHMALTGYPEEYTGKYIGQKGNTASDVYPERPKWTSYGRYWNLKRVHLDRCTRALRLYQVVSGKDLKKCIRELDNMRTENG